MKYVKIIVAVVVAVAIIAFISKIQVNPEKPGEITPPRNQFVERIENEIDSLAKSPVNVFCKNKYNDIQYQITDFYDQKYLSTSEDDNNHWRNILSRDLYSAYAPKFIQQALYVFGNSKWPIEDIKIIRSGVKELQNSPYLEKRGGVYDSFQSLQAILAKYYEISGFIKNCDQFSYSDYGIADKYPLNTIRDKIKIAQNYLSNHLDNKYVDNCKRLHTGLNEVPKILYFKHINYLLNKIQVWSGIYSKYASQKDYSDSLYTPLKNEIDLLDRNLYGVNQSIFNSYYNNLDRKLELDNTNAYYYFSSHESNK